MGSHWLTRGRPLGIIPLLTGMLVVGLLGAALLMAFPGPRGEEFLASDEAGVWVFADCALLSLSFTIGAYAWEDMTFWTDEVANGG